MQNLISNNYPGPLDSENPDFSRWLKQGAIEALILAASANSRSAYEYALRVYANGFADGHLQVRFSSRDDYFWPGFLTRTDNDGKTRVVVVDTDVRIPVGATLFSCGTEPASTMLYRRIQRTLTNPKVPQTLGLTSPWLMVLTADEIAEKFNECSFEERGTKRRFELKWRSIAKETLMQRIAEAQGIPLSPLGLRQIKEVWFISIPSFGWTGERLQQMQSFLRMLNRQIAMLHDARRVLIDLRSNDGGSSVWAYEIAKVLWGQDLANSVEISLGGLIKWRVSTRNLAAVRLNALRFHADGHVEEAAHFDAIALKMAALMTAAEFLIPEPTPLQSPPPLRLDSLKSPFKHAVYVLTDPHCASACLDFIDLIRRLSGVVQIGLPTSADTSYNKLALVSLPSGQATLAYAMKVYRGRLRRNNEWHVPEVAWPGGIMSDDAIANWVCSLA